MLVIDIKRIITRLLFVGQLVVFAWVYLFGAHGFSYLRALKEQCAQVQRALDEREGELVVVQQEVLSWNVHAFHKEKMAREQLQMARRGEIIYYLDEAQG